MLVALGPLQQAPYTHGERCAQLGTTEEGGGASEARDEFCQRSRRVCQMGQTAQDPRQSRRRLRKEQYVKALLYICARRPRLTRTTASSVQDTKAKFDKTANVLRWLGTNGMRYLLQFWFSRQALFWLPQGWVPGYVEWLLAFPRAPKGSISIQLWGIACASVISMASEAIVAAYVLVTKRPDMQTGKQEQEPQATAGGDKKEL